MSNIQIYIISQVCLLGLVDGQTDARQSCMLETYKKSKTGAHIFLQISPSICIKCSVLPQTVSLLKLKQNVFCIRSIQLRELNLCSFMKYTIDTLMKFYKIS